MSDGDMNILILLLVGFGALGLGYRWYGRYLSRQFGQDDSRPTPAVVQTDDVDYVPTRPHILFAHHFSTIAGAGPIVGPTIGILYGYVPVWLWVVLGAVFFGAVHDYAVLFASLREKGKSIGEIAGTTMGRSGRLLFLLFTLVMIFLVTSAFLSMTAISLTSMWPLSHLSLDPGQTMLKTVTVDSQPMGIIGGIASTSVIIITMMAPLLGFMIYRKGIKVIFGYIVAAAVCLVSIVVGFYHPVTLPPTVWMIIISFYVLLAAGLPVWIILQPRDFINVQILYGGMLLLVLSVVVGGLSGMTVSFPAFSFGAGVEHLGLVWPMLMITVACGAISGFHSLVASGTSSKQATRESVARTVGYGGMILEGALALLVILTLGVGLSYGDYLKIVWGESGSNPVLAFALATGGIINRSLGIPIAIGAVAGILLIEGFVVTTLDSAVRLNRYLFEELWDLLYRRVPPIMKKKWFNSALSAIIMFLLAYFNAFLLIWPLFGSANQLMAALALISVSIWLYHHGRRSWYALIPAVIMVVTTSTSLIMLLVQIYLPAGKIVLIVADLLLLGLSLGVVVLSLKAAWKQRLASKAF